MNSQIVAAPNGEPLWTSWSLLGSVHDTRAARVWKIAERIKASSLLGLGDKGSDSRTWCSARSKAEASRSGRRTPTPTALKVRSPGERAIAQLKNWDILRRPRCCPHRAGEVTRAVLVLQLREAG
jgi:hypothetical protein